MVFSNLFKGLLITILSAALNKSKRKGLKQSNKPVSYYSSRNKP